MPRQTLKKRPDGRYVCKYKGICFYGKTQTEALTAREEYKKREKYGSKPREQFTFLEYAAEWLPTYKAEVSTNTYNDYVRNINQIAEIMPSVPMCDITPSDVKKTYNEFLHYSNAGRRKKEFTIKAIFQAAQNDGIIEKNPCLNVKMPKGESGTHRALEQWEIALIEETYQEERLGRYAMLMLYAGLRRSEATIINIDKDVDFEKGVITINKAARIENGGSIITTTKTKSGIRVVPLFPPLRAALDGCHGSIIENNSKYGYVSGQNGCRAWKVYLRHLSKRAGREVNFREHDLRHTFATLLYEADVDIKTASKWMGHANEQMILRVYAHLTRNKEEASKKRMENMLFSRSSSQNGSQD